MSVSDSQQITAPLDDPAAGVDIFGMTHGGKKRSSNEDHFFVAALRKSMQVRQTSLQDLHIFARLRGSCAHLLVVADGVGGLAGGELASETAVETVAEHVGEAIDCYYNFDVDREQEFLGQLERAVERSDRQVRARHGSAGQAPATTLTMVALMWPRAYVVHVGDSRAYHLRQGRLRQITRDQTVYEELVDEGVIPEDQAAEAGMRHRFRDMLTSAVGAGIKPSIGVIDVQAGDALLLCTDGLTKHVPDDDITCILSEAGSAEESCRRLVDLTLERGASDNVTVVVARFATQ